MGKRKKRKKVVLTWQQILRERIEGKRKKNRENEAGRWKFISLFQLGKWKGKTKLTEKKK